MHALASNVGHPFRIALAWHAYRRGGFDSIRGMSEYAERFGPWQILFSGIEDFAIKGLSARSDIDGVIVFRDFEGDFWDDVRWPTTIPIVSVEHQYSQITSHQVMPDYFGVGKMVAEEFLRRGYRTFAYYARRELGSSMPWDVWEREQLAGFAQAVREADATMLDAPAIPREWVRPQHEDPPPMLVNWFKSLPRPVAIMAGSDVRSHHVLLSARASGLRVPEDIAVIGVDNEPWTVIASGGLSSVELDDFRAGYLAAQMLHQLMDRQPIASKLIRVPPKALVTRRSSDALAIEDVDVVGALRFIADHANSPIEVDQVANASMLSRRALERRFQSVLHRSIQQEIRLARIGRAKMLLRDETIPMFRVASMSGFISVKAMEALFRRMEGITPAAWRRKARAAAQPGI